MSVAGRRMPGAGRGDLCDEGLGAHREGHAGCECLLAELAQRVVAALEQLARDRQARAVVPEPLGRLAVVVAVRAALPAG